MPKELQHKTALSKEHINLEGVGIVHLHYSKQAKHIRLKVHPKNGVTLVVPSISTMNTALSFLNSKKKWIIDKQRNYSKLYNNVTQFNQNTVFKTNTHELRLQTHHKPTLKSVVSGKWINIWYPEYAEVKDEKIQHFIRHTIEETWKIEAKIFVPKRVKELALQNGFSYNRISIKNTKTRWGSCSSKKNLNFSLHIMRLPDELKDYLIIHELVHTKIPNHSTLFWNEMYRCLPYAKLLDKKLNTFHIDFW